MIDFRRTLCFTAFLLASWYVQADPPPCKTLRIGGDLDWYPISYINPATQQIDGEGQTLLHSLSHSLGYRTEFIHMPWKRALTALNEGQIDIIAGGYWNTERESKLYFSIPFGYSTIVIYVSANADLAITSLEDLKNKQGIIKLGTSAGVIFDTYKQHLQVIGIKNYRQAVQILLNKHADYLIAPTNIFDNPLIAIPEREHIKQLDYIVAKVPIHFLVSRKTKCTHILHKLNDALHALQRSPDTR